MAEDFRRPPTGTDDQAGAGMGDLDAVLARRLGEDPGDPPPPPGPDGRPAEHAGTPAEAAGPDALAGPGAPAEPESHAGGDAHAGRDAHADAPAGRDAHADAPATDHEETTVLPASTERDTPTSPLAVFDAETPRRRGRRGLVVAAVVLLVLLGAYGAAAWFFGDKVPNGTTVAGVRIGGVTETEARERLETQLAPLAAEQIPVTVGEATATIDPARAGLALDVDATVDGLTGFTLDPRALWARMFGQGPVEPVSAVDEAKLTDALAGAAEDLDVAAVEGNIAFSGTTPDVTEPTAGTAVDVDAAARSLSSTWLTAGRPVELPTEEVEPTIGTDAVQSALTELAEPLVSGPVSVTVGDTLAELAPEQLAAAASFTAEDGDLTMALDGEALAADLEESSPGIVTAGKDAQILLQDGAPHIVPSTSGTGIDPAALAEQVLAAGTSGERTATVELVESEPEFTTADAEALGVKEVVVDFSTPMPYDPVRTENLRVGTGIVNGTLVRPGEEFSLLEALGPITRERGFVSSGVVQNGFSSEALGGGLSQLSTNMYNAGYLAGYDDITHKPHSRWFDRYPAGREATMWVPTVDMIWRNNTDYGALVQAWVADGRVHTRLWSTPVWDVRTTTSDHYNITSPTTVYNTADDCVPEGFGPDGFSVTVTRERYRDGAHVDTQKQSWTYRPWNRVVCGSPPAGG